MRWHHGIEFRVVTKKGLMDGALRAQLCCSVCMMSRDLSHLQDADSVWLWSLPQYQHIQTIFVQLEFKEEDKRGYGCLFNSPLSCYETIISYTRAKKSDLHVGWSSSFSPVAAQHCFVMSANKYKFDRHCGQTILLCVSDQPGVPV